MTDSQQNPTALLYAALARAQGEYRLAAKNRTASEVDQESGEINTWQYADLDEIIWAVRDALAKYGLAVSQTMATVQGSNGLHLVSKLLHEAGGEISSVVPLSSPQSFIDIKQFGAEVTLLRRYCIEPLLGITSYYEEPVGGTSPSARHPVQRKQRGEPASTSGQEQYPEAGHIDYYDQDAFDSSLEGYKLGIANKLTTSERIISMLETKAPLTDEQRQTILDIEVPQS